MDYAKIIVTATLDVFEMMIPMEVSAAPPLSEGSEDLPSHVTSMLGLSGDLAGVVHIHCSTQVACGITAAMLGTDVEEIDSDVKDAVGEVANMVAGGLKVALAEEDVGVELAIPSVLVGKSFRITAPTGTRRIVIPFNTPSGQFWVELKFRLGS